MRNPTRQNGLFFAIKAYSPAKNLFLLTFLDDKFTS